MPLGIDSARHLDGQPANLWNQFINNHWKQHPTFAGRYFRSGSANWTPGELTHAPASLATIQQIVPLGATGAHSWIGVTGTVFAEQVANGVTTYVDKDGNEATQADAPLMQYFTQIRGEDKFGRSIERTARGRARVQGWGETLANQTVASIQAALDYTVPGTGNPELKLPASGSVFVFLDLEPFTRLSPYFWMGWAGAIFGAQIAVLTTAGTVALEQPLLPCLYCLVGANGPPGAGLVWPRGQNGDIADAFTAETVAFLRGRHSCRALMTPYFWPPGHTLTLQQALTFDEAKLQTAAVWPPFGALPQGQMLAPAPVVIWQHFINIAMNAGAPPFEWNGAPPEPSLSVDLDVTSAADYNGRPITDYMLQRA